MTATGFRMYVKQSGITPSKANSRDWHVNWMAVGAKAPTPSPTPAPTAAPASILNDPHVASLGGDRFDINQPAEYVLLRAPLEESQPALLELRGLVKPSPARPCGLYVKAATLGGAWFGKAIAQVRPLEQSAAGSIGWPFSLQVSGAPWKSVADLQRETALRL